MDAHHCKEDKHAKGNDDQIEEVHYRVDQGQHSYFEAWILWNDPHWFQEPKDSQYFEEWNVIDVYLVLEKDWKGGYQSE